MGYPLIPETTNPYLIQCSPYLIISYSALAQTIGAAECRLTDSVNITVTCIGERSSRLEISSGLALINTSTDMGLSLRNLDLLLRCPIGQFRELSTSAYFLLYSDIH